MVSTVWAASFAVAFTASTAAGTREARRDEPSSTWPTRSRAEAASWFLRDSVESTSTGLRVLTSVVVIVFSLVGRHGRMAGAGGSTHLRPRALAPAATARAG